MLRFVLILVMVGLLVAGGIFLFFYFSQAPGAVQSARDVIVGEVDPDPEPPIIERFDKEKIITVAEAGFIPQELTTPAYQEVIWENQTNSQIYIEHYPEEGKNKYQPFSLGETPPGESASTSFFYKGRYRYWDKLHPERVGFIIVE